MVFVGILQPPGSLTSTSVPDGNSDEIDCWNSYTLLQREWASLPGGNARLWERDVRISKNQKQRLLVGEKLIEMKTKFAAFHFEFLALKL